MIKHCFCNAVIPLIALCANLMMKYLLATAALCFSLNVATAQVKWMTWNEAVEANAKNPKKIFVDVYTDWCGWCKRMDQSTFSDKIVAKALNDDFYAVKFNAEQKEDIVFNGKTYKFVPGGRRGSHELARMLLQGRMGYPTVVFLNERVEVIQPVPGYQEPTAFLKVVNYFGEDLYKTTPWNEYQGR